MADRDRDDGVRIRPADRAALSRVTKRGADSSPNRPADRAPEPEAADADRSGILNIAGSGSSLFARGVFSVSTSDCERIRHRRVRHHCQHRPEASLAARSEDPPTPATSARRTAGRSNTTGESATCGGIDARNSGGRYSGGIGTMASICLATRPSTSSGNPTHKSRIPSGCAISSRMKRPNERLRDRCAARVPR